MAMKIRIAMAQLDSTVGDLVGNAERAVAAIQQAKEQGVHLVILPEMFITGYPTNDLLFENGFVEENEKVLKEIVAPQTKGIAAIIGGVLREKKEQEKKGEQVSPPVYNVAAVVNDGEVVCLVKKTLLPNYDVFDEKRYFRAGTKEEIRPVRLPLAGRAQRVGIEICEDLWDEDYEDKVTKLLYERGADFIVNISASPFYVGKGSEREGLVKRHLKKSPVPFIYVNMVGGQDELVFDGGSFAADCRGNIIARAAGFEEEILVFNLDADTWTGAEVPAPPYSKEEEIIRAHTLNLRDYFQKQGCFKGIVVGSSGGIDSAYTLYIATQAIGADKVMSVSMPSRFSSEHSRDDAARLAENLGVRHVVVPIEEMFEAGMATFERAFGKTEFGLAEENDQARCRMQILMKISRKYDYLVCTTGNKSEISTGYFTLFGDGAGGKNIPGDLYKTEIYKIVRYINREKEIIPQNILLKAPSAELAPDQKDSDTLPPYSELDPILKLFVEDCLSIKEIVSRGYGRELVEKVARLYKNSEFKRDQIPRGIKVSRKAYGIGRRMPITNQWHG
ncbi:MAG: NAD+ synthase [bacterium]